jgi:hypothetical protein
MLRPSVFLSVCHHPRLWHLIPLVMLARAAYTDVPPVLWRLDTLNELEKERREGLVGSLLRTDGRMAKPRVHFTVHTPEECRSFAQKCWSKWAEEFFHELTLVKVIGNYSKMMSDRCTTPIHPQCTQPVWLKCTDLLQFDSYKVACVSLNPPFPSCQQGYTADINEAEYVSWLCSYRV